MIGCDKIWLYTIVSFHCYYMYFHKYKSIVNYWNTLIAKLWCFLIYTCISKPHLIRNLNFVQRILYHLFLNLIFLTYYTSLANTMNYDTNVAIKKICKVIYNIYVYMIIMYDNLLVWHKIISLKSIRFHHNLWFLL